MKTKHFSIKKACKILVEHVINENYLEANVVLENLIKNIEKQRENSIYKRVILEADENVEELGDNMEVENTSGDETEEVDVTMETETDSSSEPETEDVDLGENLSEEEDDVENQVGNGKANEMATLISNLNHKLNKAKINKLYNKISTLKSLLNASDLDKKEMKYLELDTSLAFYSEALEALQQQSMPGVEGTEQQEISEKIELINEALKKLASEIENIGDEAEAEEVEVEVEEDVDADAEADAETEAETEVEEADANAEKSDDGEIENIENNIDEEEDVEGLTETEDV